MSCLIFLVFYVVFWGGMVWDYSQMANLGFRMDSNSFSIFWHFPKPITYRPFHSYLCRNTSKMQEQWWIQFLTIFLQISKFQKPNVLSSLEQSLKKNVLDASLSIVTTRLSSRRISFGVSIVGKTCSFSDCPSSEPPNFNNWQEHCFSGRDQDSDS